MNTSGFPGKLLLLCFFVLATGGQLVYGQQTTIQLSRNSTFSSEDRNYFSDDTLFVKVVAPQIDHAHLDKNRLELSPRNGGASIERTFQNNRNGTYTGQIILSTVPASTTNWSVEIRIEDDRDFEVRREIAITITAAIDGSDDTGDGGDDSGDGGDDSGDGGDDSGDGGDDSGDGGDDSGDGGDDSGDGGDDSGDGGDDSGDGGDDSGDGGDDSGDGGDDSGDGGDDSGDGGGDTGDGGDDTGDGGDDTGDGGDGTGEGVEERLSLAGALASIEPFYGVIDSIRFQIDAQTLIRNEDNTPIPHAWLRVGEHVTVALSRQGLNTFMADEIILHAPVASRFHMHQNYPNPFSERTILELDLFDRGSWPTRVVIFDALGRIVEELVNSELSAGRHTIEWTPGLNNTGWLAKGTYFCRVEIAGFSQTRVLVYR